MKMIEIIKIMPIFKWLVTTIWIILCWPVIMWKRMRGEETLMLFAFFVGILPLLHGAIIWQHKGYVVTTGVQANLIVAVIWYFLCGIAINIGVINIDGCGFLEFPKISNFMEEQA
jgi:hypothetical protein